MNNYKNVIGILIVFLMIGFVSMTSCKKPDPPIGVVIVKDSTKTYAIEGARVIVGFPEEADIAGYVDPEQKIPYYEAYTDAEGRVEFEFLNENIFHVWVTKEADNIYPKKLTGEGVLILKNDETDEEQIYLR